MILFCTSLELICVKIMEAASAFLQKKIWSLAEFRIERVHSRLAMC